MKGVEGDDRGLREQFSCVGEGGRRRGEGRERERDEATGKHSWQWMRKRT